MIYDESIYPEIFSYFSVGSKAVITNNISGNVMDPICVCNGSKFIMNSLGFKNKEIEKKLQKINEAKKKNIIIIEIDNPPDYIMVKLTTAEDENILRKRDKFPDEFNLNSDKNEDYIIYPLRIKTKEGERNYITLKNHKSQKIFYEIHSIYLAFCLTVWKV